MARLALALFLALAGSVTPMAADVGEPSMRLLTAAARGDLAELRRLIAAGAPVEARDGQGRTALLLAVDANHVEIAKALLDAGASVSAQAANLDTPWLLAGARGRTAIIAMMLPKKPDLAIRNRFGGNALIPACERAHVEAVRCCSRPAST
jgi:ankyrin repeat protein